MSEANNIHPIFERLLSRQDREKQLGQKAKAIWLMGLSGSGKSTIAKGLENELYLRKYHTFVLDGDNIRSGINSNLSFSEADRRENIRRVAETAKLMLESGIVVICCFITPTHELQQIMLNILGEDALVVYVNTTIEECEKRDVKGLYAKARAGEIKDFTGINAPFEAPLNPAFEVHTTGQSIFDSFNEVLHFVLPEIKLEDASPTVYEQFNI
jgi:adenylylsulfate kinase